MSLIGATEFLKVQRKKDSLLFRCAVKVSCFCVCQRLRLLEFSPSKALWMCLPNILNMEIILTG